MTPQEIQNRIKALAALCGPKAYISMRITTDNYQTEPCAVTAYPTGLGNSYNSVEARGNTFEEALSDCSDKLMATMEVRHIAAVRKFALDLIDLAAADGEVPTAGLRQRGYTPQQIQELTMEGVKLADELAGKAPFFVVESDSNQEAA